MVSGSWERSGGGAGEVEVEKGRRNPLIAQECGWAVDVKGRRESSRVVKGRERSSRS